jgi:hypothetical protein
MSIKLHSIELFLRECVSVLQNLNLVMAAAYVRITNDESASKSLFAEHYHKARLDVCYHCYALAALC